MINPGTRRIAIAVLEVICLAAWLAAIFVLLLWTA